MWGMEASVFRGWEIVERETQNRDDEDGFR